jgi:hypothetical protein
MRTVAIDPSRGLATAGVLLSAVVHLDVRQQGFRDIHAIGPLFPLNATGGLVIGVGFLAWRHWLPVVAAAGVGAATILAFWISVGHGLLGVTDVATGTSEVLAEYAATAFGLVAAALLSQPMRERVA